MPSFMRQPLGVAERKQRRGKFFPFIDKFQTQRDPITIRESLGDVFDGTATLKYSQDVCSADVEDQQIGFLEEVGFPNTIVEFAPHNDFDESKHAPTGFTDITQFVQSVGGSLRSRTYEIGRFEAGSINVKLDNFDGRFTPGSKRSPYFPDVKANRRLRIRGRNMQNTNVATGGGDYQDTIGFRKGTGNYVSAYASEPFLGTHSLFALPTIVGTNHIRTTLAIDAPVATHDLIEWFAPIELGVRLTHSAYIWKISGTEAADSLKQHIIVYYDSEGNELSPINAQSCAYSWTDETPTSPMRVHISDQPPAMAKYGLIRLRVVHRSMKNVYSPVTYAISGCQTEVPENNLAPFTDAVNFFIEGSGQIYNDGQDGVIVGWGSAAAGAGIKIPRCVPGDTYTFSATVVKQGVELIMTADEGQTGYVLDNDNATLDVSGSFIANRPEEEVKFIPLEPLPPLATNIALGKAATGLTSCEGCGHSPCGETPDKAVNGSWTGGLSDKYCTHIQPGLLTVDVGEQRDVIGFIVRHARAGGETANYNTKDFNILVSDDGTNFTTVESVTNNADDTTLHAVVCRGRYFRLSVTTPTQIGDIATRIYEFEVYANDGLLPTTVGSVLTVKNLTVRKGDVTDVELYPPIPNGYSATAEENGLTDWEYPKPIFEGWTEDWPATTEDLTSHTEVTVNDRSARLGAIELSHTAKETLFSDDPALLIPFADDPIDSQGKVSNLGSWSATNGMSSLPISGMNVDLTGTSYQQGIAGPTDDNAIQFNRAIVNSLGVGYMVLIPFVAEFVPKLSPPSNPTGPLPLPADGYLTTKNYYATWSHSYTVSGALRSDDATSPYIYQGDCTVGDSSCSGNGDLRGLIGFNFNGIITDLTGATIRYVGLSIHAVHWWWFAGGHGVFGTHDYADRSGPQTWSSSRVKIGRWRTGNFRRDSWQTISLGVGVGYEFLSNKTLGISVGPALTNSLNYYGYFDGAPQRYKPYLTIQYVK